MKLSRVRCLSLVCIVSCVLGCGVASTTREPPPREAWDAFYMQGSKIGYGHTQQVPVDDDGRRLLKVIGQTEMTIQRFGQSTTMRIECTSWETFDGSLMRFECTTELGPTPQTTRGRIEGRKLVITPDSGRVATVTVPKDGKLGGFNAIDQSLARAPMKPGETRSVLSLWPVVNQPAATTLVARDFEPTVLLSGTYELLRIDAVTSLHGSPAIESTLWTDRGGEVLKNQVASINQTSYRTSREVATGASTTPAFDLGEATLVQLASPLDDPHQASRIVYKITLAGGDPARVFATGQSQQVRTLGPHEAEVTVRTLRPDSPLVEGLPADRPTDDDRRPSDLVQSDDPTVVALAEEAVLAKEAAPGETDPWTTAVKLEAFVHRKIRMKNFSQALASAAEVASSLEGDCTEHAVLLAALARARGLPSRVALGLVAVHTPPAFGFHMWTEIWVGDRWIPMDATLGLGGAGPGHLKLAHTSLATGQGLASFLHVAPVLGRLKVEVLKVDRP
ncbi:MAG TPA: transglutaminase-like domain-containing protein [Pirellulales bacterium]|jgi:transglutaminase-like putative cysteine protease|nr:transglutaminase-like domain-containing protein [Pirellulales bacterium]